MDRKGLHIIDVEPDGNCLFRSISHQFYGDAERHLKASVVEKEKEKTWQSIPRVVYISYCSADAGGIRIGIGMGIGKGGENVGRVEVGGNTGLKGIDVSDDSVEVLSRVTLPLFGGVSVFVWFYYFTPSAAHPRDKTTDLEYYLAQ